MAEDPNALPSEVDVLVLGTGLPLSILAAACARAGKTVLHLDVNEYYGQSWSSFTLDAFIDWLKPEDRASNSLASPSENVEDEGGEKQSLADLLQANERLLPVVTAVESGVEWPSWEWSAQATSQPVEPERDAAKTSEDGEGEPPAPSDTSCQQTDKDAVLKQSRRFSIDVMPKLLLSKSAMVELLVRSGTARYAEFTSVNRLLCRVDGNIKQVPTTRSDIFASADLSMMEKRKLMKLIEFCVGFDATAADGGPLPASFSEFLRDTRKLEPQTCAFVLDAVAMVDASASTEQGIDRIREFIGSAGVFGASPLLACLYGSGELAQCFCRLCAVFGGVYCLRQNIQAWIYDGSSDRISGVVLDGKRVSVTHVIACASYLADLNTAETSASSPAAAAAYSVTVRPSIQRAVLITTKSLLPANEPTTSLLNLPADEESSDDSLVHVLEFSAGAARVAPSDYCLVHLSSSGHESASSRLSRVVRRLYDHNHPPSAAGDAASPPRVLCSGYFDLLPSHRPTAAPPLPANVHAIEQPEPSPVLRDTVGVCSALFARLYPGEPFLPEPEPEPAEESTAVDDDDDDPVAVGQASDAVVSGGTSAEPNADSAKVEDAPAADR